MSNVSFTLKHERKPVAQFDLRVIDHHFASVVVESPGGRLRLPLKWIAKNQAIHASIFPRWMSRLGSLSRAQQLIPLSDPIVLQDRVGGRIDVVFPETEGTTDCEHMVSSDVRGQANVWVPIHATAALGDGGVGVEWWMLEKVLEATSRHRLDLDPLSPVPVHRGCCPYPAQNWPGLPAFASAVREAFRAAGVEVAFEFPSTASDTH